MFYFSRLKMEFIGSFLFIFLINLLAVEFSLGNIGKVDYGIGCFVIYCILLWAGKALSDAQYNPAITVFLMISGHVHLFEGIGFITSQFSAGIFAATVMKFIISQEDLELLDKKSLIGFPLVKLSFFKGIMLEAVGMFFVVFVYYMLLIEKRSPKYVYAPGIAAIFFVVNVFLLEKTGASLNPARFIGLAIMENFYYNILIYIIGPIFGGIFGSLAGSLLLSDKSNLITFKFKVNQNLIDKENEKDKED